MDTPRQENGKAGGFAAVALVVILVPMLFVIGAYLQTMMGRNQRLQLEIREEQAMLTAESGIDLALNEARRGSLRAYPGAVYTYSLALPHGGSADIVCSYLKGDGNDDDGDGNDLTDVDEDVFRVVSTGTTQTGTRRVAVYLGYSTILPALRSAVTLTNASEIVDMGGAARVNGNNYTLGGVLVGSGNTYGMTIAPPGTLLYLDSQLTGGERGAVTGTGAAPSIDTAAAIDVAEIVTFARQSASVVITNSTVSAQHYGTSASPVIAYREGNVKIQGNSDGYGLLVVKGDLRLAGTFRWYGVIVCTGLFECGTGTAQVYGGVLNGPASAQITLRGTIDLRYSSAGVDMAQRLTGRYVAFNGWQEISTN